MKKYIHQHGVKLYFKEGTTVEVLFSDGKTKRYDLINIINKFPTLNPLKNREFFLKGKLEHTFAIVWNDEIDIDIEDIYYQGKDVKNLDPYKECALIGFQIKQKRLEKEMTQKDLSRLTGIDQSDISKIEKGLFNPSILLIKRIAQGLGCELKIILAKK